MIVTEDTMQNRLFDYATWASLLAALAFALYILSMPTGSLVQHPSAQFRAQLADPADGNVSRHAVSAVEGQWAAITPAADAQRTPGP